MQNLERITRRLIEHRVEFIITGGWAALIHGSSLTTQDVDIVCPMSVDNLTKLFNAVAELHPVHRLTPDKLPFTREQIQQGGFKNLYLSTDWGQLDCLGEIKGLGNYSQCLAVSVAVQPETPELRILSLDALITAKRSMGRPRDLHTVLELEAIREKLK
jgi:hypothetical protein